ncbi:hypothetical protein QZH41_013674 [Actinostola sp. cb2023]|nr:hypothetical protein QZH41_013674 [Actinostola sp. cb2023]
MIVSFPQFGVLGNAVKLYVLWLVSIVNFTSRNTAIELHSYLYPTATLLFRLQQNGRSVPCNSPKSLCETKLAPIPYSFRKSRITDPIFFVPVANLQIIEWDWERDHETDHEVAAIDVVRRKSSEDGEGIRLLFFPLYARNAYKCTHSSRVLLYRNFVFNVLEAGYAGQKVPVLISISRVIVCKKHCEDDVDRKLSGLGISGKARKDFKDDIFGNEKNKELGLIDSKSEENFDTKLYALEEIWDEREKADRKTIEPEFLKYFKSYLVRDMKEKMILPMEIFKTAKFDNIL